MTAVEKNFRKYEMDLTNSHSNNFLIKISMTSLRGK